VWADAVDEDEESAADVTSDTQVMASLGAATSSTATTNLKNKGSDPSAAPSGAEPWDSEFLSMCVTSLRGFRALTDAGFDFDPQGHRRLLHPDGRVVGFDEVTLWS
jgi:hypothetical protein